MYQKLCLERDALRNCQIHVRSHDGVLCLIPRKMQQYQARLAISSFGPFKKLQVCMNPCQDTSRGQVSTLCALYIPRKALRW